MNLEKKLSKEILNLLKEKEMKASDFISQSASFPDKYFVRHTKKALNVYKEANEKNIIIWNH